MGAAAIPLMVGSTALLAYGQYKEGKDTREVDKYNARVGSQQGDLAVQEALSQEQIKRGQDRGVMARQHVLMGSSGITGGTFEDVAAQSAEAGELDAMAIRMGGTLAKMRARSQASIYRASGQQAYSAGLLGAVSSASLAAANAGSKTG